MSQRLEIPSSRVDQTMAISATIARHCQMGDVVALIGDLGSGKTQFVCGMARGLGIDPSLVTSPTFVLVQEYGSDPTLVHIDAYRLRGPDDLESIGWSASHNELCQNAIVAVEWADRVLPALGSDRLEVRITHTAEGRCLTFTPYGDWRRRTDILAQALEELRLEYGTDRSVAPDKHIAIVCSTCGNPATKNRNYSPFCSQRCQAIDLGQWLDGRFAISRRIEESDLDEDI